MCIFKEYRPQGILSDCVHSIIYYDLLSDHDSIQRLLPDGSVYLTINLDESPLCIYDSFNFKQESTHRDFWMSGMYLEHLTIKSPKQIKVLSIKFKSTGAYPILGIPMHNLRNAVVDADLIFGKEIVSLREQILNTQSADLKIRLVEKWLYQRLRLDDPVSAAVAQFAVDATLTNPSGLDMKSIAGKSGYTQQHFISIFKKYVGVSPKQFERVVRFNQILKRVNSTEAVDIDWSGLAFEVGYYDQSHLIKDFKRFSGFSPNMYLSKAGEFEHHVPVG